MLRIGNRLISESTPTFIIAEISANHVNSLEVAIKTVQAAAKCGVDAIKTQTFKAYTSTMDSKLDYFKVKSENKWDGRWLYDLYLEAEMPWEWNDILKEEAQKAGIEFFSSVTSIQSFEYLEKLDVPAYKFASFEITDQKLIDLVSKSGKPLIFSTGIAELSDIKEVIDICRKNGNNELALLKCVSSYPSPVCEANLRNLSYLKDEFNVVVGVSDHSLSNEIGICSIVLGGRIIEKHFILDKSLGGPDSDFSLNPQEMASLVNSVRTAEKALGKRNYEVTPSMKKGMSFGRSLIITKDLKKGSKLTVDNFGAFRPGCGLHPREYENILGKKVKRDLEKGMPLSWDLIE